MQADLKQASPLLFVLQMFSNTFRKCTSRRRVLRLCSQEFIVALFMTYEATLMSATPVYTYIYIYSLRNCCPRYREYQRDNPIFHDHPTPTHIFCQPPSRRLRNYMRCHSGSPSPSSSSSPSSRPRHHHHHCQSLPPLALSPPPWNKADHLLQEAECVWRRRCRARRRRRCRRSRRAQQGCSGRTRTRVGHSFSYSRRPAFLRAKVCMRLSVQVGTPIVIVSAWHPLNSLPVHAERRPL